MGGLSWISSANTPDAPIYSSGQAEAADPITAKLTVYNAIENALLYGAENITVPNPIPLLTPKQ